MQHQGSHGRQPTFGETIIGLLFVAIFIAALYALYSTWPYWLLLVPLLFLLPLRRIDKAADAFGKSFSAETSDLGINKVRKALVRTSLWLGMISALICFGENVQLHNLGWALVPLIFLCISYRLRSFSPPAKKWPKFRSALNSNLFELLLISVVVLAVYSVLLWWLQSLPLNDVTLDILKEWDERVQTVHEFLEAHTPKLVTFLLVLAITIALRFLASIRPQFLGVAKGASGAIARTTKWFERVSTAVAIAASLTFLATGEGGPASQIGITLRAAREEYTHFQSAVERRVDDALRQAFIEKAWLERPRTVRVATIRSAQFLKERDKFDTLRDKAHSVYDISVPDLQRVPSSAKLNTPDHRRATADTAPDASWTPAQVHQAAVDPSLSQEKDSTENTEGKDSEDEIAKKVFEELWPKDYLFDHTPAIAVLKAHYPVFGEFLDAITSSISEASFDSLRESLTRKIVKRKKQRGDVPIERIVSEETRNNGDGFRIDFVGFDNDWERTRDSQISGYLAAIGSSEAYLRERANERKQLAIAKEMGELRVRQAMLIKVGHALGSQTTSNEALDVKEKMLKLEALANMWPALDEPTGKLESQLNAITMDMPFQSWSIKLRTASERAQDLLDGPGTYSSTDSSPIHLSRLPDDPFAELLSNHGAKKAPNERQALDITLPAILSSIYPLGRIQSLTSYCDGRLTRAVADNYSSVSQTRALRTVMGSRYSMYYDSWHAELARAEERRQQAIRERQEAIRQAAARERQREERVRETEVREHPVEVP